MLLAVAAWYLKLYCHSLTYIANSCFQFLLSVVFSLIDSGIRECHNDFRCQLFDLYCIFERVVTQTWVFPRGTTGNDSYCTIATWLAAFSCSLPVCCFLSAHRRCDHKWILTLLWSVLSYQAIIILPPALCCRGRNLSYLSVQAIFHSPLLAFTFPPQPTLPFWVVHMKL